MSTDGNLLHFILFPIVGKKTKSKSAMEKNFDSYNTSQLKLNSIIYSYFLINKEQKCHQGFVLAKE